jgi:hypothetical protein
VPLTVFTPVTITPKPLTVRLLADEFRYSVKSLIRLELVNPNNYACQELRVFDKNYIYSYNNTLKGVLWIDEI